LNIQQQVVYLVYNFKHVQSPLTSLINQQSNWPFHQLVSMTEVPNS